MYKVLLTFANGDNLTLSSDDRLSPISRIEFESDPTSSMGEDIVLVPHDVYGLTAMVTSVLCSCDFFYVNRNHEIAYGSKAVVKIEFC